MSKHTIEAGDVAGLLGRFAELRRKALARTGTSYPIIVIQEAGLDGFWLPRVLQEEGCESHVVDAASVAAPRRRRRAKTDRIDGEALLRALLAYNGRQDGRQYRRGAMDGARMARIGGARRAKRLVTTTLFAVMKGPAGP